MSQVIDFSKHISRPCRVGVTFDPFRVCFTIRVIPLDNACEEEARRRLRFSETHRDLLALGATREQVQSFVDCFRRGRDCLLGEVDVPRSALAAFRRSVA